MFSGSAVTKRSSPVPSWFGRQQLAPRSCRCHRPTVIREPSPGALLAISQFPGHHGPSSFTECITESWWRAHQTRLAVKVPKLECLVVLICPAFFFIGVFSFGRVLLQVLNPSFAGAQPCGVPNPSAHAAFDAFSFAFPLGLFNGFSCFSGLRPRLAIARHILRCALPLASRGGILGPWTLFFLISFALALRSS